MSTTHSALDADWLGLCRRSVEGLAGVLRERPSTEERAEERRGSDGRLEVLGIESADPRWVAESIEGLRESCYRLRVVGSIAVALCHVAAARFDGMVSLRRARGVDAAAGQLIVREAGGVVSFPSCEVPLGAPLDAEPRSPVIAARSPESLTQLERIPA